MKEIGKNITPILAVETSSAVCSTAIYFDLSKSYLINMNVKNIHSEKLLTSIDKLFSLSGIELADIGAIAVSNGPGSFTGLRIGLAAVKGLALGANKPVVPVNTFSALSLKAASYLPAGIRFNLIVHVNRDEVYFSQFISEGDAAEERSELRIVKKSELSVIIKPDEFNYSDEELPGVKSDIIFPDAEYVAKWSYIYGQNLLKYDFDYLEPEYVKQFYPKVKK